MVVYLGVIFKQAGEGHKDKRSTIISAVVLVVGFGTSSNAGVAWTNLQPLRSTLDGTSTSRCTRLEWSSGASEGTSACNEVADGPRAEAKSKGLSEDTVMAEIGGHKEYLEQNLDEARSPILRNPGSYQNPYDIG